MTRIFLNTCNFKSFGVSANILSSDIGIFYGIKESVKDLLMSIVSLTVKAVGKDKLYLQKNALSAIVLGLKFFEG